MSKLALLSLLICANPAACHCASGAGKRISADAGLGGDAMTAGGSGGSTWTVDFPGAGGTTWTPETLGAGGTTSLGGAIVTGGATRLGGTIDSGRSTEMDGGSSTSVRVRAGNGGRATAMGGMGDPKDAAAAGGAVGGSPPEPEDTRPARPEWNPPFSTPLGSPGWQQSTEPICDHNQGFFSWSQFDVWADERGIFALLSDDCGDDPGKTKTVDGYTVCGKGGMSVKFNSGSGWQLLYQFPTGTVTSPKLWPSFPHGPLLLTGWFMEYGRGAAFIERDKFSFQGALKAAGPGFAVGPDRAFLFDETRLLEYLAGTWSQAGDVGGTLYPTSLWADPHSVISTAMNQVVLKIDSGPFTSLPRTPIGTYQAVWAFAPDDIWLGNRANQLMHYDGSRWQAHEIGGIDTAAGDGIRQLWGASGTLYFTTQLQFGRWNGSNVEILLRIADRSSPLGQFWGRSANEVFIPVRDDRYQDKACGSAFLLWFDGTQFHQF